MRTSVTFHIRLSGSQNAREHWRVRAKRVKAERLAAYVACMAGLDRPLSWPVTIRLTRIGPRRLDSDNVCGSLKGVRDSVAEFLGVDDGDESRVLWEYAQERGDYAVRIEVVT